MNQNTHTSNPKSLRETWLDGSRMTSNSLQAILKHASQVSKLNHLFYQWLSPKYHGECQIANLSRHQIIIHVTRPALATHIFCHQQEILNFMKEQGEPFTQLQVSVNTQSKKIDLLQKNTEKRTLSPHAAKILEQTIARVSQPKLKKSLQKIVLLAQKITEKA